MGRSALVDYTYAAVGRHQSAVWLADWDTHWGLVGRRVRSQRPESTRKDYPPYRPGQMRWYRWCMTPWPRRKGKESQLTKLRAHVETTWAIGCCLTGDEATAVEVVRQVARGTLPQTLRFRESGLRLEVVIAATDAAAGRVFSPLDRRARAGAYAAALSPQASALRRAFSRRLSWDVQALLWATEVEEIAESDVTSRLGQIHPGREAGRAALRLAYLDLRKDLHANCTAALREVFASAAGPGQGAADSHVSWCAPCQAEIRWLTHLRSALLSLPPAMPPDVWEEARRLALRDTGPRSYDSLRFDGAALSGGATSAQPWPSPTDSRRRAVALVPVADQAKVAVGEPTAATNGRETGTVGRAVEAQKVKGRKVVNRVV